MDVNKFKNEYAKYYYPQFRYNEDDRITLCFEKFIEDDDNIKKLINLNECGIQPAVTYLCINYKEEDVKIYKNYFKSKKNKQYFGTLFGALFRMMGYRPIHHRKLFLREASIYKKLNN